MKSFFLLDLNVFGCKLDDKRSVCKQLEYNLSLWTDLILGLHCHHTPLRGLHLLQILVSNSILLCLLGLVEKSTITFCLLLKNSLGSRIASSEHCHSCRRSQGHLVESKTPSLHFKITKDCWVVEDEVKNLQFVEPTEPTYGRIMVMFFELWVIPTNQAEGEVMRWFYLSSPRLD